MKAKLSHELKLSLTLSVILRTGAVVKQWRGHETSACGQNDLQSYTWFQNNHRWIITCFTTVSLVTWNIRGSSICSQKSLYKKTSQEILAELKAAFKTGESKVPRPRHVLPSLLRPICQACFNSQLASTPPSPPRRRKKKNVTKMNFSSCNDHNPKWIINDCYIFFPYLRVWVFLFLWTSFFTTQHVGPMLHE